MGNGLLREESWRMQTTCLGRRKWLWSWFKQVSSRSYPAGPVSQDKIAVQVLLLGDLI